MLCLGLDLAWGKKATSGACALQCDVNGVVEVLGYHEALGDDEDILQWIDDWDKRAGQNGMIIGVDAPLLVPNFSGERPCESQLRTQFARFHAGAHPANRRIFGDDVRGEHLVAALNAKDILHDPEFNTPHMPHVRRVMEVFPHPAHIVLFELDRTLKYKAKKGRDAVSRANAFDTYARHLRGLSHQIPSLKLPSDWPRQNITGLIGSSLKRYEDGLDALTCGYIAAWAWWHGTNGYHIIGDLQSGYIVVPKRV